MTEDHLDRRRAMLKRAVTAAFVAALALGAAASQDHGTRPLPVLASENFESGRHAFKVTFDAEIGEIKAYLDDMQVPILTAGDRTFVRGRAGVGSFDDTELFDDLTLRGILFK
jgi:hypothetical protein